MELAQGNSYQFRQASYLELDISLIQYAKHLSVELLKSQCQDILLC